MSVLYAIGTRPELIKLAPVIRAARALDPVARQVIVFTGQHRELLSAHARQLAISPDHELHVMAHEQSLNALVGKLLVELDIILTQETPRWVVVQGDTSTALAAALAASHCQLPVAHVEAGLRTSNPNVPFPEERNRRLISALATLHFAPTPLAMHNLLNEGVSASQIEVTGNTGVDALFEARARHAPLPASLVGRARLIFLSLHRREHLDQLSGLLGALRGVLEHHPEVTLVWPLHPRAALREAAHSVLEQLVNVQLLEPLDHATCVTLLSQAELVVTDSGGVQEEAVTLGTPLLVLRAESDRPEGITEGRAALAPLSLEGFAAALQALLAAPLPRWPPSPLYGAGDAGARIARRLLWDGSSKITG